MKIQTALLRSVMLFGCGSLMAQEHTAYAMTSPDRSLFSLSSRVPLQDQNNFCSEEAMGLVVRIETEPVAGQDTSNTQEKSENPRPLITPGMSPDLLHPFRQIGKLPMTSLHFVSWGGGASRITGFIFTVRLPNLRRSKIAPTKKPASRDIE